MKSYKKSKKFRTTIIILIFLLISGIIASPILTSYRMIIGVDGFFHFHRFYDAAMQIQNNDFHYFTSFYGFNQSGRMVNPTYGPVFAYFNGILLLIMGNWIRWQFAINFLVTFGGLFSSYIALRWLNLRKIYSFIGALLIFGLMPTLSWYTDQSFMNIGSFLLPLAVSISINMVKSTERPIKPIQMGSVVALGLQLHMLSALFMVIIMVLFAIPALFKVINKTKFILKGCQAAGLALLLSVNVWVPIIYLNHDNILLRPFIEGQGDSAANTIGFTWDGSHGITIVLSIMVIFSLVSVGYSLIYKKIMPFEVFYTLLIGLLFICFSTQFIPWRPIMSNQHIILSMFQFPMRFAIPGSVIIIMGLLDWGRSFSWINEKNIELISLTVAALSIVMIFSPIADKLANIKSQNELGGDKVLYQPGLTPEKLLSDERNQNLSLLIKDGFTDYPDYLPISKKTKDALSPSDWYNTNGLDYEYRKEFIFNPLHLESKTIRNRKIYLSWSSNNLKKIILPVVKYKDTQIVVNGGNVSKGSNIFTKLGAPIVNQKIGVNKAVIWYKTPSWFIYTQLLPVISLMLVLIYIVFKKRK